MIASLSLKEKTIGLLLKLGYKGNVNQSTVGLMWLDKMGKTISNFHSKLTRLGEKSISGVYVDGFDPNTNTIYQFNGCFFHGCPDCFDPYAYKELTDCKFYQLYEQTERSKNNLFMGGYKVVDMWECEFMKTRSLMRSDVKANKRKYYYAIPLNPRDALLEEEPPIVVFIRNVMKMERSIMRILLRCTLLCRNTNVFLSGIQLFMWAMNVMCWISKRCAVWSSVKFCLPGGFFLFYHAELMGNCCSLCVENVLK